MIPGASKELTCNEGKADIADLDLRQLYEIKPIEYDEKGETELWWYLSFLPGWNAGINYPHNATYFGAWPGDMTRSVFAQMMIPGVIAYWGEKNDTPPVPIPVPVPGESKENQENLVPQFNPEAAAAMCAAFTMWGAYMLVGGGGHHLLSAFK